VVGSISGVLPRPTLIALAAIPLAGLVHRGLRDHYESPYELMPAMARNIQLHLAVGMLLILGYVIALVAGHLWASPPLILR